MLVLSRKLQQSVMVGTVRVTVLQIKGNQVRLAFEDTTEQRTIIMRSEIIDQQKAA